MFGCEKPAAGGFFLNLGVPNPLKIAICKLEISKKKSACGGRFW